MKVFVKNLLRPAHSLAFVFGVCPYRKFDESTYRRSALGTILQLTNVVLTMSIWVYIVLFDLYEALGTRDGCSSLKDYTRLILQTNQIFLSLWLTMHHFVRASTLLRCLRLADELNESVHRISNSKQQPFAFYIAMICSIENIGTITYLMKIGLVTGTDLTSITLFVTMFITLYCETLMLEFVTVICLALDTVNQELESWQTGRSHYINDLKRLQSLYLKAAHLTEVVDDAFGISWLVSLFSKSIQIVLLCICLSRLFEATVVFHNKEVLIDDHIMNAYLVFPVTATVLRCYEIFFFLHQPGAKRLKMISTLSQMITQQSDNGVVMKMNEFTLQVTLRKMSFTAGGFFDIDLYHFGEIAGTWFTLLVIIIQGS